MNKPTQAIRNDMNQLAENANALIAATADVAGEKVGQARQRLQLALDQAKEMACQVRAKALEKTQAADEAVREHPYQAIGIAAGVGALIGFLVTRRRGCNDD